VESRQNATAPSAPSSLTSGAPASPVGEPVRVIALQGRRKATVRPYDDLRELAVVVWARTKLIARLLAARGSVDPRLIAGLADIDAAAIAVSARLDTLEDALPRRAA
jgi:hypothetical protein